MSDVLLHVSRYGVGSRFKLKHTRSIINAIHSGELNAAEYQRTPIFDLRVSQSIAQLQLPVCLSLHLNMKQVTCPTMQILTITTDTMLSNLLMLL